MWIDSCSYRFSHISHAIRALQSSTKTSLRIETEGLLSLQFLVPVPKARGGGTSDSFIEFRVGTAGASGNVFSHAIPVYGIRRRNCVTRFLSFPPQCPRTFYLLHDRLRHSHVITEGWILTWIVTRQTVKKAGNSKVGIKATEEQQDDQNRPSKYAAVLSLGVGGTDAVDGGTWRAGGR